MKRKIILAQQVLIASPTSKIKYKTRLPGYTRLNNEYHPLQVTRV